MSKLRNDNELAKVAGSCPVPYKVLKNSLISNGFIMLILQQLQQIKHIDSIVIKLRIIPFQLLLSVF